MKLNWLVLTVALMLVFSSAVMADYTGVFTDPFDWAEGRPAGDGEDPTYWDTNYADYDDHVNDDGLVYYNHVDGEDPGSLTLLEPLDRKGYTLDTDGRNQQVEIVIDVDAYIPCFLEMKLTGNQGTTSAMSYGADAQGEKTATGYHIVFDNEIGGYLNDSWVSLGHGQNAEITPGDDVFIGACDMFAVEVISNDQYSYAVESSSLLHQGGTSRLDMYMNTSYDNGTTWVEDVFDNATAAEKYYIERGANVKSTFLHNFKVPFNMETTHGHYDGEVIFRAATI